MHDLGLVALWVLVQALKSLPLVGAYYLGKHVGRKQRRPSGNVTFRINAVDDTGAVFERVRQQARAAAMRQRQD